MNDGFSVVPQRIDGATTEVESLVNKRLGRHVPARWFLIQNPDNYFHIVFAETVQPQVLARGIHFAIGANFRVAVFRGPGGDLRMKTFPVLDNWRQQEQIAALL